MTIGEAGFRYPRLVFTTQGRERLNEVLAFVDRLELEGHEHVARELETRLKYLNDYGGPMGEEDPRPRFRVTLGADWAPYSFTVTWETIERNSGEYRFSFNGGLIWHGGSNDPLTVSLDPTMLWGIHT